MEGEKIEFYSPFGDIKNKPRCISNEHASMDYYQDENEDYVIEEMSSNKPGEAKKIVKAFVDLIGPNKKVKGIAVIEPESRKRLSELGVLDYVDKDKKAINITTPGVFKSLKITRMLMGGGLKIDKITISPIPEHLKSDLGNDFLNPRVDVEILCHS
jgi:hypothetical protein